VAPRFQGIFVVVGVGFFYKPGILPNRLKVPKLQFQ